MGYNLRRIRRELKNYYGTAGFNVSGAAFIDHDNVDSLDEDTLIELARSVGIDVDKDYEDDYER